MKAEKLTGIAEIIKVDSCCIGCMAWESPLLTIRVWENEDSQNFQDITWHSDNIPVILYDMDKIELSHNMVGCFYDIDCLVRNSKVWRIKKLSYR